MVECILNISMKVIVKEVRYGFYILTPTATEHEYYEYLL